MAQLRKFRSDQIKNSDIQLVYILDMKNISITSLDFTLTKPIPHITRNPKIGEQKYAEFKSTSEREIARKQRNLRRREKYQPKPKYFTAGS